MEYNDPFIPYLSIEGYSAESVSLLPEVLRGYDAVVLVTDHSAYNWEDLLPNMKTFIDTRNVSRGKEHLARNIVKL